MTRSPRSESHAEGFHARPAMRIAVDYLAVAHALASRNQCEHRGRCTCQYMYERHRRIVHRLRIGVGKGKAVAVLALSMVWVRFIDGLVAL